MTDHHNSCRCPYCEQQRNIVAQIAQPPLSPEQVFEESDKQLKKDTWLEALNWFEEQIGEDEAEYWSIILRAKLNNEYTQSWNAFITAIRSQIEEKRKHL